MTAAQRNLDLAVIGNCEIAALIDADGTIVFACLPLLDGDPVFCALIGSAPGPDERGVFAVELLDCAAKTRRYVRNTAILETTLADEQGNRIRIHDFCPRFRARGRTFRPMMIVRLIEPLGGRPVVRARVRPVFDHGATAPRVTRGSHHLAYHGAAQSFRVTTNASLSAVADEASFVVDGPIAFVLGADQTIEEPPQSLAQSCLAETREYWQDWVRGLAIPFDWQEAVIRAAISLKLCTFEDTGAVLASLTTSIPESAASGRNWDYRYCWLRDSYFVIQALNRLGATRTMEGYLRFIDRIVAARGASEIPPLFSISGKDDVPERSEPKLRGYRALAVHAMPDAGPWEFRSLERVHTFSAAMCWAGVDRLARIADRLGLESRARYWRTRADTVRAEVLERSWNAGVGAFTASYGGDELDATALLLPELGLIEPHEPRFQKWASSARRSA